MGDKRGANHDQQDRADVNFLGPGRRDNPENVLEHVAPDNDQDGQRQHRIHRGFEQ